MVVPFKLVRDPFNHNKILPVYYGDDKDVIFRNSRDIQNDDIALGESPLNGKMWNFNKWSTKKDRDSQDITVTNALNAGEKGDENKTSARKNLRNY